ncbi:SCO family protein [Devosia sp. A8/3-2]|nr:SCO family protein [Devosia sp. A8/3-2]
MTSKSLRNFRIVLWSSVAVVALGATALYVLRPPARPAPLNFATQQFAPASTAGGTFTQDDLKGKPSLIFSATPSAPMSARRRSPKPPPRRTQLGLTPDQLRIIFVTVDPERDTLDAVKGYVEGFDPSIIGLVGDAAQTEAIKAAFGVFSEKAGEPNDPYYLVNHTALTFLIDAEGKFEGTVAYEEAGGTALAKVKRLVQG